MAKYFFADVGQNFALAFDFEAIYKLYNKYDSLFDQLKGEAIDLISLFGGIRDESDFLVIFLLRDGTSLLAKEANLTQKEETLKIFPLPSYLFEENKVWARAILKDSDRYSFLVNIEGLKGVAYG